MVIDALPEEVKYVQPIVEQSGGAITLLAAPPAFQRYKGFLSLLDVLVTPNTGPMHMAAALGTPLVALFSRWSPEDCGPYMDPARYLVLRAEDTAQPALEAGGHRPWPTRAHPRAHRDEEKTSGGRGGGRVAEIKADPGLPTKDPPQVSQHFIPDKISTPRKSPTVVAVPRWVGSSQSTLLRPQPQRVNIQYRAGMALRMSTVLLVRPPIELRARFSQMSLPPLVSCL